MPDLSTFKVVFLYGVKGDADLNRDGYVTGSELGMHLQEKVVNYTRVNSLSKIKRANPCWANPLILLGVPTPILAILRKTYLADFIKEIEE
ncbi:MAG: hypothetical protein Q7J27_06390 [Syntrophales bacterium]|nr:hypothetical protein [Syntrophales bacterium]